MNKFEIDNELKEFITNILRNCDCCPKQEHYEISLEEEDYNLYPEPLYYLVCNNCNSLYLSETKRTRYIHQFYVKESDLPLTMDKFMELFGGKYLVYYASFYGEYIPKDRIELELLNISKSTT
jgi:hypothetical protein